MVEKESSGSAVATAATPEAARRQGPLVIAALALGVLVGYAHLRVHDLGLAALMVGAVCLGLGFARPQRPWRWALILALCVPAVHLVANLGHERFTRGGALASFALLIPAFSCAYGGAFGRRLLALLFPK